MDNFYSMTGWSSGRGKPVKQAYQEAHDAKISVVTRLNAELEEEARQRNIAMLRAKHAEAKAKVEELQKQFDATWPTEGELARYQFGVFLNEKSSYVEKNLAWRWLLNKDDIESVRLYKELEAAKAELEKIKLPYEAPVKIESAFVQRIKQCRSLDDALEIPDFVLEDALKDETDIDADKDFALCARVLETHLVFCKTVGQVARQIRSLKLRKRVAEHQAKHEDPRIKALQDEIEQAEKRLKEVQQRGE